MWKKLKEIPAFVSAIIAVLASIIGIVTWVSGYFATQAQLKQARCIAEININILSKQLDQKILYDEYCKKKMEISKLDQKKMEDPENFSDYDIERLISLITKAESDQNLKESAKNEAHWLLSVIKSGNIFTASGDCKSQKR